MAVASHGAYASHLNSFQTDNHANTSFIFYRLDVLPTSQPTVKALKVPGKMTNQIDVVAVVTRGIATAGDTGDASPVRPTMSPYIKMTTDSLSSELTFDE